MALNVSQGTVRNDLDALEAEGRLIRVHGGAVLNEQISSKAEIFQPIFKKMLPPRRRSAAKPQNWSWMAILCFWMPARRFITLPRRSRIAKRLRVFTNGIDTAQLLAQEPTNSVILLGGVLDPEGSSVTGLLSEQIIKELHIQKAFVSCSGLSITRGLTEVHLDEAQLKRKAIESAREVNALVGSTKIGK